LPQISFRFPAALCISGSVPAREIGPAQKVKGNADKAGTPTPGEVELIDIIALSIVQRKFFGNSMGFLLKRAATMKAPSVQSFLAS
jgi:hypothetical protein